MPIRVKYLDDNISKGVFIMKQEQLQRMQNDNGFIAALDQSGGSTPKALKNYGINEDAYKNDEEMFKLVHEMRTRIMKAPAFNKDRILAAILFEVTMNSEVDGKKTPDFLLEKNILPIFKIDKGLADLKDDVQLMKPIDDLKERCRDAFSKNIFGTKMRSVIKEYNEVGIKAIVDQQFDFALTIFNEGLVPIIEPEVDINSKDKAKCEELLKKLIIEKLDSLDENVKVIFKLTLPERANFYKEVVEHPRTLRFVALSGGYSREDSNKKLAENNGIIASFSRALTEGLSVNQSDDEFNKMIGESIDSIYEASIK